MGSLHIWSATISKGKLYIKQRYSYLSAINAFDFKIKPKPSSRLAEHFVLARMSYSSGVYNTYFVFRSEQSNRVG